LYAVFHVLQAFPIIAENIPVIVGNGNIYQTAGIGGNYAIGIDETAIDEAASYCPMKAAASVKAFISVSGRRNKSENYS
jgi:hypothetical protein